MPWLIYDPKLIDKPTSRKLFGMTEYGARDVPVLRDAMRNTTTYVRDKPTEIPEGMALRFLPTSDDVFIAKDRIESRIMRGELKLPPWRDNEVVAELGRPKWASVRHVQDLYMPAMTADGAQIEYYANYTHMVEDRRTTTTIGRFLQTLWANYDEAFVNWMTRTYGPLTDDLIRLWSEQPKSLTMEDVKFAMTPDEIEHVYNTGPSSCMGGKRSENWQTGINPVRAYGAGDLAVAWLPKRRDPLTPSQRAMCWPEKKLYSRIYGTGPLEHFLKELGFTTGTFHGARLLKIETDNNIVLPYIDYHDKVVERRDHLRIWHKTISHPWKPEITIVAQPRTQRAVWSAVATTSGAVQKCKCRHCGKTTHQEDANYTGDWALCRKCAKTMVACCNCHNVRGAKTDKMWTWILTDHDLSFVRTLKDIHGRSLQAMCPACAATPRLRRDYRFAGYTWVSAETGQPVDLRS